MHLKRKIKQAASAALEPFVIVVAAVYFVIDALVLSILKPFLRKIANLKLFKFIAPWIAPLGPYPTLALFVVPLTLLEPIKPFSAYLIASGHFIFGMLILILAKFSRLRLQNGYFILDETSF